MGMSRGISTRRARAIRAGIEYQRARSEWSRERMRRLIYPALQLAPRKPPQYSDFGRYSFAMSTTVDQQQVREMLAEDRRYRRLQQSRHVGLIER